MNVIHKLLNKFKRERAEVKLPEAGEVWYINDGSPWVAHDEGNLRSAKILAVREGWVRYMIDDGFHYPDERMRVKTFVDRYRYVPQHERAA